MTAAVKLCKDCRHCRPDYSFASWMGLDKVSKYRWARCALTGAPDKSLPGGMNLVIDTSVIRSALSFNFCPRERTHGECGPEGKLWEPKP